MTEKTVVILSVSQESKIKIATGPFATLRVTAFYVILSVAEESQSIAIRFFVTNVPQND